MKNEEYHEPVMVHEVISTLNISPDSKIIDATLGTAGHTIEILKLGATVLGIESDKETLEIAKVRLMETCPTSNYKLVNANFNEIDVIAKDNNFSEVTGILFDLGVNNLQLTSETRGFSYRNPEAPIDMRVNPDTQGVKGSDLLNVLREDQLVDLFSTVIDRGSSKWIARQIVRRRNFKPVLTIGDLSHAIREYKAKPGLNFLTLPLLAIRIAVNSELENLKEGLKKAYSILSKGGKILVITFHSGEDEIVKSFAKTELILPSSYEINNNLKSRSAKLRIITKNE